MSIMASSIFGPTGGGGTFQPGDVQDSGESGHHYYYIKPDKTIYVDQYQQYIVHERDYLEIDGSIDLESGAEIIIGDR